MIGQTISHYRILEKLGEGGMGVVYKAEDTKLRREVALKALSEQFAKDPERIARLQREARTLASVPRTSSDLVTLQLGRSQSWHGFHAIV